MTQIIINKNMYALALVALALAACNKDKGSTITLPVSGTIVKELQADGKNNNDNFTLFSFAENGTIPTADSASNRWDIGFKKTTLIINGGSLRKGSGGAFVHFGDFDALTTIADTITFATDNTESQLAIPTGSGNGWYSYSPLTNTVLPIAGRILVVRTGNGKFAKLEILSYYKGLPKIPTIRDEARFYTFRYTYQPDGSKNFN
jgi:hypothetical protein